MSRKAAILIGVVVVVAVLAGAVYAITSGSPRRYLQLRTLDQQTARWQAQGLKNYQMQLGISCFCPFIDRMPLTVQVREGQVVSVTDSQGRPVAPDDPIRSSTRDDVLTIEGVLAYSRDAIRNADEVRIAYDPSMGFPASLSIDWIRQAMDDELSITIQDVRALP